MGYEVRRLRADEWQAFKVLRLEALRDTPTAFLERYESSVEKPDEFWTERVTKGATSDGYATFVAVQNGALIGKASARITDEGAEIVGVYVTPAWRGGDDPPASRVVRSAVDWALDEAKAPRVTLFVTDSNARAAAFYRRLGFVPTGRTVPYDPDPALIEIELEYLPVQSRA